tara:strand:- start:569 stop:1318 length:750 start_codon:yes stop_codon:yes gene_type:complete
MKKVTIREVLRWLKSLDENKWRRTYKVDAKRVAYFINLGEDVELPKTLRSKRESITYGREKTLAKKYLESFKQNESLNSKIRELIKEEIKNLNEESIQDWKKQAMVRRGAGSIKGNNKCILNFVSGNPGKKVQYELNCDISVKKIPPQEKWDEGKKYFYTLIRKNPDIYLYVSKATGGAIKFRGKGRWSGNAEDFGRSVGKKLGDVRNKKGGAMPLKDIENVVKKSFPGLIFKIDKLGSIEIDWTKIRD